MPFLLLHRFPQIFGGTKSFLVVTNANAINAICNAELSRCAFKG